MSKCKSWQDFNSLSLKFNNLGEGLTAIKGMEYSYPSEEVPLNKTSEEIIDLVETILSKAKFFILKEKMKIL